MEQYILKSALVAEIENLVNTYKKCPTCNSYEEGLKYGRLIGYEDALHKINTIEVKEVDNIWHDANEKLPTGVIVVSNGGNLHIGWSTDEGDGIEDEHGHLITKTYQKWAREKDLI